jgi:4-hydroxy-2-oxoheptanedioate aldolase
MPLAFHSLRQKLRDGRPLAGVFCELPCPEAVEIIGLAGWDFTVIDCEHSPLTAAQLPAMVRAAGAAGIPAIVRVASAEPSAIQHALDAGASGVQIPQIASVDAARAAIAASRFHPDGQRGFNPFVRAADFSLQTTAEFFTRANAEVSLILQIESAAGIEAVDGILALPGIDALFIGPYDLSQSLGVPGETTHAKVFAAAGRISQSANARGVALGVFTNSAQDAQRWLEIGVRYLCLSVDSVYLLNAMRAAAGKFRQPSTPAS